MTQSQQEPASQTPGTIPLEFKDIMPRHIGTGTNTNPPRRPPWQLAQQQASPNIA